MKVHGLILAGALATLVAAPAHAGGVNIGAIVQPILYAMGHHHQQQPPPEQRRVYPPAVYGRPAMYGRPVFINPGPRIEQQRRFAPVGEYGHAGYGSAGGTIVTRHFHFTHTEHTHYTHVEVRGVPQQQIYVAPAPRYVAPVTRYVAPAPRVAVYHHYRPRKHHVATVRQGCGCCCNCNTAVAADPPVEQIGLTSAQRHYVSDMFE